VIHREAAANADKARDNSQTILKHDGARFGGSVAHGKGVKAGGAYHHNKITLKSVTGRQAQLDSLLPNRANKTWSVRTIIADAEAKEAKAALTKEREIEKAAELMEEAASAQAAAMPVGEKRFQELDSIKTVEHRVRSTADDTLAGIASLFHVDVEGLFALNPSRRGMNLTLRLRRGFQIIVPEEPLWITTGLVSLEHWLDFWEHSLDAGGEYALHFMLRLLEHNTMHIQEHSGYFNAILTPL